LSNLAYDDVISNPSTIYKCRVGGEVVKFPKNRKSEIDGSKIKIVHTMADGTVRDSVEGYVIPYNETTAITYELLAKWAIEKQKKSNDIP